MNTGFGILAKSYLDATSYHNQLEPITEEMIGTERAETAKRQAILFIEENFSSVKGPVQELERGFRFWDAVSYFFLPFGDTSIAGHNANMNYYR